MNSFRTFSFAYLSIVALILPQTTAPRTRQVSGVVETLEGKRLPNMTIRVTNIGGTTTSDSGEFVFYLPPDVAPGQPIQLSLGGDWIISSPWEGRTFVPMLGTDSIQVRVAHKGDPRLLAEPDFVKNIVVGVTSELKPLLAPGEGGVQAAPETNEYLASKAKDLGLTVEQIKSAIDQWIAGAQGPYQKGLAALYAKRFGEASQLLKQSIASSERDLLAKYEALANAETRENRYPDAESALRKALAIRSQDTEALNLLGWLLAQEDRFNESESTLKLALQIDEKALGDENPAIAPTLSNLGGMYGIEGHFPEAEAVLERELAIIDKDGQGTSLIVGICLNNLAEILRSRGKYPEAESDAQRALAIESLRAGPSSLEAAYPLVTLGLIYKDIGLYSKAVEYLDRALAIEKKELEPSDPAIVRDIMNLASVYGAEGSDFAEAQRDLEQALSISQGAGRGDSLEAAGLLCDLGQIYDDEGRYSDSTRVLENALKIAQEKLGPGSYRVATVLRSLGFLSVDEKKFDEAERLLRMALVIDEKDFGPDHLYTAEDHKSLGYLNFSRGSYPAAESEYVLSYASLLKSAGPRDPEVWNIADLLATTLRIEGKDAEAAQYENLAAKARRQSGDESPPSPDKR